MKIISMILCLCFTANVFASSNLEAVFNDYQYAMTVEWDQKDQNFRAEETEKFYKNLDTLISQGLSVNELMNFAESKIQDKKVLESVRLEVSKATSQEEILSILNQNAGTLYSQGTNWTGREVLVGGIVAAGIAFFAYSVYFSIKYGCKETLEDGTVNYCNPQ